MNTDWQEEKFPYRESQEIWEYKELFRCLNKEQVSILFIKRFKFKISQVRIFISKLITYVGKKIFKSFV